jgi:protein-S-isoprenylcysteine O-methyltransferase Ste14
LTRDLLARFSVGALFVLLTFNLLGEFLRTRHVTGLLLLASEALVVVLTIVRRRTSSVNPSAAARGIALVSMVGPPLLRAAGAGVLPDAVTAAVSGAGLCLVIAGKLTLGRSFGIVAANRGVVASGPYRLVRHPIYVGYLITHVAFLAAYPTFNNIALVFVSDTALLVRAFLEERTLIADDRYRMYCNEVAWHFVPGVF